MATMDITVFYGAILAIILISATCRRFAVVITERFQQQFRRNVLYPLALTRRNHTDSITRLDVLCLLVFLGANGVILGWSPREPSAISRRASQLSLLNIVPLFLGGKTNPLISFVGIPLSKYYFAHHWFGRVAAVEALIHLGISIYKADGLSKNGVSISGYLGAVTLIIIVISSVWFIRKLSYGVFIKCHTVLSLSILGALVWHTLQLSDLFPRVLSLIAAGFWLATTIFRLSRTIYHGMAAATVQADEQAVRAIIRLPRPLKVYPGCYFYLYFPSAPFRLMIRGYPMNVVWWNVVDNPGSGYSSELIFLLYRQGAMSKLAQADGAFRKVLLDGPYGRDLRLYEYENVILAAKGQGIAGILPHALHLAGRRTYDKKVLKENPSGQPPYLDKTRKIDLFWVLEDNSQQRWLREELRLLQKLDPSNRLLCIWCIYPSPQSRAPPFEPNEYWRCFYPSPDSEFHQNGIAKEIGTGATSPGRSIVVACGEPSFAGHIRDVVIKNASMEYVEMEYRPTYSPQSSERRNPARSLRRRPGREVDLESQSQRQS
ncbi:hypothetical protein F4678DRAFT_416913 [Xylaria arbuscula]|nr:hypothetical protein F4678DRAFT_416913 [Xylaria arbuscula]